MTTKVFSKNKENKIEFTETQLKKLLDEIYNEGYEDGKKNNYYYTTPYKPYWGYNWGYTTTTPLWQSNYITTCSTDDNHYTISSTSNNENNKIKWVSNTTAK